MSLFVLSFILTEIRLLVMLGALLVVVLVPRGGGGWVSNS